MQMDKTWKESPPNVSYKAFDSLISNLHDYLPVHLDNSYLSGKFSKIISARLMSALSFLNLIEGDNKPTERLKLLVAATTREDRAEQMKMIAYEAYAFVLKGPVDLQHATYEQIENLFYDYGVKIDLLPKCVKFFVEFAKNAGIPLSPQMTKKSK